MIIHCMLGMSRKTRWVGPMKCTKHWILIRLEQINHKSTLISDFERGSWYVRNPKSEVILWEISNVLLKIERRSWKTIYSWSDLLLRQPTAAPSPCNNRQLTSLENICKCKSVWRYAWGCITCEGMFLIWK